MQLSISVLADRPDLADAMWDMENSWPEFMRHDPIGGLFYGNVETRFADYVLIGQDADEVVACAYSIPFVLDDDELPDNGWDFVIRNGVLASIRGTEPNAISAVEIAVRAGPPGDRPLGPDAHRHAGQRRPARLRRARGTGPAQRQA